MANTGLRSVFSPSHADPPAALPDTRLCTATALTPNGAGKASAPVEVYASASADEKCARLSPHTLGLARSLPHDLPPADFHSRFCSAPAAQGEAHCFGDGPRARAHGRGRCPVVGLRARLSRHSRRPLLSSPRPIGRHLSPLTDRRHSSAERAAGRRAASGASRRSAPRPRRRSPRQRPSGCSWSRAGSQGLPRLCTLRAGRTTASQ